MKEVNPLNMLLQELITLNYIEAAYVENRKNELEEIYLHLVISKLNQDNFVGAIFSIIDNLPKVVFLKKFKNSCYVKFEDNVSGVLLFDYDNFDVNTKSMVLYDPNKKLVSAVKNIQTDEAGYIINEISYNLDRFYNSYQNEDALMALRYLNIVNDKVLLFLKETYNPERVYRDYKTLIYDIPKDVRYSYNKIIYKLKIDSLIECAKMFIVFMDEYINKISINIAFIVDIDYYMFVKKNIFS